MSVELILAVVGAADLCLKYGSKLARAYQNFKNADAIVADRVLKIETVWSRTAQQIEVLREVEKSLVGDHRRIYVDVLNKLYSVLVRAITEVEALTSPSAKGGVKKVKTSLVCSALDRTMAELEEWRRLFDPSWFLILRIKDEIIDLKLASNKPSFSPASTWSASSSVTAVASEASGSNSTLASARRFRHTIMTEPNGKEHFSLPEEGLDWDGAQSIAHSETRIVRRTSSNKQYAVDSIRCGSGVDGARVRDDAETLVRQLQQADPGIFGLLACYGLVKRKHPTTRQLISIDLVFRLPLEASLPTSLRKQLLEPRAFSLTEILDLARQLAKAVSFVHTCGFVHKNIRPETILLLSDDAVPGQTLGAAYLLGFDSFRSVNFHTMRSGDAAWPRDLYRHPSRQGLHAQENYIMQHDVYSLGVCLLELGLWQSFVEYTESSGQEVPSAALGLQPRDFEPGTGEPLQVYSQIKDHLVALAKSQLPMRVGNKYTAVVVTCLTCLDDDNPDFADDEMRDEDGILIGIRFIEKVLFRLSDISF